MVCVGLGIKREIGGQRPGNMGETESCLQIEALREKEEGQATEKYE